MLAAMSIRSRYSVLAAVLIGICTCVALRSPSAPLPGYALLLEGGQTAHLAAQRTIVLRPETRLSITLRPDTAVSRRVRVHARVADSQHETLWPVFFEQTPQGTLRLQGIAQELLPGCTGRCTLTFYLSSQWSPSALLAACPHGALRRLDPSVQVLQTDVIVERP